MVLHSFFLSIVPRLSPADLLLLLVVVVWGFDYPVLKWPLAVMHPHVVNASRFIISASVLGAVYGVWCWRQGDTLLGPISFRWRTGAVLGLLGFGAFPAALMVGLQSTTAGSAALMMATSPLWTAILAGAIGSEQLRVGEWVGLLVALTGAGIVIAAGASDRVVGGGTLFGNGVMLVAAILWGSYTALTKRLVNRVSPLAVTVVGVWAALPVHLAIGSLYAPSVAWDTVDRGAWGGLLFSGGLAVGIMFLFWNLAVRRVGASHAAAYYYLVPFVALLAGAILLKEPISLLQITGGGLIIGGLLLLRRTG